MIAFIQRYSPLSSRLAALHWTAFYSAFLNIHRSGVLTAMAWLVPHETAAVSAQVLCTQYNHAPCHIMQSHIIKSHVCLFCLFFVVVVVCFLFVFTLKFTSIFRKKTKCTRFSCFKFNHFPPEAATSAYLLVMKIKEPLCNRNFSGLC